MKPNAYLARQKIKKDNFMHSVERIIKQYMIDTLIITLHDTEGWGYDRLMRLMKNWDKTREEYRHALNPRNDAEADIAQAHIDSQMVRIINGKQDLIPWDERYPDLHEVKYGGK